MSIIDTKCVLACRKEGWASESKNDNDNAVFVNYVLIFVGFFCPGLTFMAQHLMKYLLFDHPYFATFDKVFITNFVTWENKPRL